MMIADIFNEHRDRLIKYAASLVGYQDAEDVVQEVFVEVCRYPDSVLRAKNVPAYLTQMTKHAVARFVKNEQVVTFTTCTAEKSAETEFLEDHLYKRVIDAINALPTDESIVAKMRFIDGMRIKDIASELSMNYIKTVNVFNRAKTKLKEELKDDRDF